MLPTKRILAALSAAAVIGLAADAVQAQEYGRGGDTRAQGGTQMSIGGQVFHDTRGIIVSDYEMDIVGGTSTLDERIMEHDVENTMTHDGAFVTIEAVLNGKIQWRGGAKIGFFQATVRSEIDPPATQRNNFTSASEVGIGLGLLGSMRTDLSSAVWFSATLDFTFGQAAVDNEAPLLLLAEGTYTFFMAEVTPRIGVRLGRSPVSLFAGLAISFYQGDYDLDVPDSGGAGPGTPVGESATVGNWSFIRLVFGLEFSEGPAGGRLQFSIWNPSRDLGAAVELSFPIG